jgi:diguanylate cyclase (GGDEF)-like protein
MSGRNMQFWVTSSLAFTLFFHVFYALWLLAAPVPHTVLLLGNDILETVGGISAALFCLIGVCWKPVRGVPSRHIALLCGLGLLCYVVQQGYIIYPDFAHHAAPIPLLAVNLVGLASYPLLLLGIWQIPRRPLTLAAHLRISLDGLMVIAAALTFSWYFILGPALIAGHNTPEAKFFSVTYPLMDLLLIAFLLLLGRSALGLRQTTALFAGGLILVVISDSLFTYLSLHGLYHAGTLLDIGWSLGFMPIGIAATAVQHSFSVPLGEKMERAPALWKSFLPYGFLPCVAALAVYSQSVPGPVFLRAGVLWCGGSLVGLILVRQVLAILENHELSRRLEALATRDPLTGLLNHRAFHQCLEEQAEQARRDDFSLAVAMIDLDNFKFFNDAYGHPVGDEVLRSVALALKECGHSWDTVARFGGDEFALLMPQTGSTRSEPMKLRDEILACVANLSYSPPGAEAPIPLTLSVGVAVFPGDAESRLEALEVADARLRGFKTGAEGEHSAEQLCLELSHTVSGFSMLNALVTAVDNKDRYTRRHSEDVMTYSLAIGNQLGLDAEMCHIVSVAALLHDVGKIGIPDRVLRKPGKLTEEEYQAVQQHPMMGAVIVGAVAGFEDTLDVVRHHHERWDGAGYPFGFHGEETPFLARLVAVADAFSAMTTDRPYRKGMSREKALSILAEGAGTQWDPDCVSALIRVYDSPVALAMAA